MKYMIETLAYAAGLLDGEGSIIISAARPSIKGRRKHPSHYLAVNITNTDKDIINWLYATFGGHFAGYSRCGASVRVLRVCWTWGVSHNKALVFLELVYPYLRIKKKHAELAIEFQKARQGINTKSLTEEQLSQREHSRQEMCRLNLG